MSQGIKRKFVHLAYIKHQGKALSMLGEIGTAWRPKTRPKKTQIQYEETIKP